MRVGRIVVLQASIAVVAACACAAPAAAGHEHGGRGEADRGRGDHGPIVIGHRGAAGYLPDHTLAGYRLAIRRGADYVEPDLVATKDGVLVARHEPNIKDTTDVASHPEFADRRRHQIIDGVDDEGWFVSDFTFKELETLRAVQPFAGALAAVQRPVQDPIVRSDHPPGQARVASRAPDDRDLPGDQAPDVPQKHRAAARGPARAGAAQGRPRPPQLAVFIQSFEQSNLKQLNRMINVRADPAHGRQRRQPGRHARLHEAVRPAVRLDRVGRSRAAGADVCVLRDQRGPRRGRHLRRRDRALEALHRVDGRRDFNHDGTVGDENGDGDTDEADRGLLPPTDLIQRAHQRGLLVHTWTFRNEPRRLAADYRNIPIEEYLQFYELGIDGVFSDFPDTAVTARELLDPGED